MPANSDMITMTTDPAHPAELLSIVISLKPVEPLAEHGEARHWWGRAVHAFFLKLVAGQNPELAQELHDDTAPRPFSTSSLIGRFDRDGRLKTGETYWLRLTAMRQDVCQVLQNAIQPGGDLAVGAAVELDYTRFGVTSENEREGFGLWQATTSYAKLGAPYLLASQSPPHRLRLLFTSPASFKSEGRHIPLPLPRLVFGSLLERWNTFAPLAFPLELRRYFEECLVISRYELKTQAVHLKEGGVRVGMTGWVDFSTLNYDRYWMSLVTTLARYALFAGIGVATTQGMGQCRLVEENAGQSIS